MLCRGRGVMLLLIGGALSAPARAASDVTTAVTVRIHDYASFESDQLQRAQDQVSATYARIGVRLGWKALIRPAAPPGGEAGGDGSGSDVAAFTVVLLSSEMAARRQSPPRVAGFAPVTRERGGHVAFVIGDRARAIARDARVGVPLVLAGIIAHEIAHLLIPERSHTGGGLMRPQWAPAEFRGMDRLGFSAADAAAIRESAAGQAFARVRVGDGR